MKISKQAVLDVQSDTGADIRSDYSGRFMYGDKCLGIVSNRLDTVLAVLQYLIDANLQKSGESLASISGEDAFFELQPFLEEMRSDSMGQSTIWYFPFVQVSDN